MPTVVTGHARRDAAPIELEIFGAAGVEVVDLPTFDLMQSLDVLREADALTVGLHRITAEVLDEMPNCRIVCRVGTGVDAIDIPAATERGIWVTNVPDYSIDEVSSHAIALTLALARRLFQHRDATRNGDWRYMADTPIRRLAGCRRAKSLSDGSRFTAGSKRILRRPDRRHDRRPTKTTSTASSRG